MEGKARRVCQSPCLFVAIPRIIRFKHQKPSFNHVVSDLSDALCVVNGDHRIKTAMNNDAELYRKIGHARKHRWLHVSGASTPVPAPVHCEQDSGRTKAPRVTR